MIVSSDTTHLVSPVTKTVSPDTTRWYHLQLHCFTCNKTQVDAHVKHASSVLQTQEAGPVDADVKHGVNVLQQSERGDTIAGG